MIDFLKLIFTCMFFSLLLQSLYRTFFNCYRFWSNWRQRGRFQSRICNCCHVYWRQFYGIDRQILHRWWGYCRRSWRKQRRRLWLKKNWYAKKFIRFRSRNLRFNLYEDWMKNIIFWILILDTFCFYNFGIASLNLEFWSLNGF